MELRVGASLVAETVTVKVCVTLELVAAPSLTTTLIVAVPFWSATGVKESEPVALGLV
jgi:hypothetical protein